MQAVLRKTKAFAVQRIQRHRLNHPLYEAIGVGVASLLIGASVYKGYLKAFNHRHCYIDEAIALIKEDPTLLKTIGDTFTVHNSRSGTIDSVTGHAKSKLFVSGPLGKGILHFGAQREIESTGDNALDPYLLDEADKINFSLLWEYPFILKVYLVSFVKNAYNALKRSLRFSANESSSSLIETSHVSKPTKWKICNCLLVIPSKNQSQIVFIFHRIFNALFYKNANEAVSYYALYPLLGNPYDFPAYYGYLYSYKAANHDRAKRNSSIFLSVVALGLVILGGWKLHVYFDKAKSMDFIKKIIKDQPYIQSNLKDPVIREISGIQNKSYLDLEISLLGKPHTPALLRLTAGKVGTGQHFTVHRLEILMSKKWTTLPRNKSIQ